jgi:hypothetical protein
MVVVVQLVFEHDQVIVAVAGEVHNVGAELRDAVEEIARCGRRPNVELSEVAMQGTLHRGPDPLLLPPHAQISFRRRAQDQYPQPLDLWGTQFPQRHADRGLCRVQPLANGGIVRGRSTGGLLLFTLAAALLAGRFRLFGLEEAPLQRQLLLGGRRRLVLPSAGFLARRGRLTLVAVGFAQLARSCAAAVGSSGRGPRLGCRRALLSLLGSVFAGLLLGLPTLPTFPVQPASVLACAHPHTPC